MKCMTSAVGNTYTERPIAIRCMLTSIKMSAAVAIRSSGFSTVRMTCKVPSS